MAAGYRPTRVEQLEGEHPGLQRFVEELMAKRLRFIDISDEVKRKFGVMIPANTLTNHWVRRFRKEQAAERDAGILLRAAAKNPDSDDYKIATAHLATAIKEGRMKLAEADILEMLAEQRKRRALELELDRLNVQMQEADTHARDSETRARLAEAELERAQEKLGEAAQILRGAEAGGLAAADGTKAFDPAEALKKISAVIGTGAPLEERIENSEL